MEGFGPWNLTRFDSLGNSLCFLLWSLYILFLVHKSVCTLCKEYFSTQPLKIKLIHLRGCLYNKNKSKVTSAVSIFKQQLRKWRFVKYNRYVTCPWFLLLKNLKLTKSFFLHKVFQKNIRERNISQLILGSQHYSDTKTRQDTTGKLQTDIPHKHGCKNPWQKIMEE